MPRIGELTAKRHKIAPPFRPLTRASKSECCSRNGFPSCRCQGLGVGVGRPLADALALASERPVSACSVPTHSPARLSAQSGDDEAKEVFAPFPAGLPIPPRGIFLRLAL